MMEDTTSIAPYSGERFTQGLRETISHPLVPEILRTYFPQIPLEKLAALAATVTDADALQKAFVDPFIKGLLAKTSSGLTFHGGETLESGQTYLFLSTHRDIVLDPGLFAWALFHHGLRTPEICLGDNLLATEWVTNLMKLNKGITVKRSASHRELLRWSQALSEYVRGRVVSGAESVWLAQREGRAKDGDDRTQPGVLKMLSLSGEGELAGKFRELRVRPIAISYEFSPCDMLIAREQYHVEKYGAYEKRAGEDTLSIRQSFGGWKGGIRIDIGTPLDAALNSLSGFANRNEQLRALAAAVDDQIIRLYHLWPSNYIASDLLEGRETPSADYTLAARQKFRERMEKRLAEVASSADDIAGMRPHFLRFYATPVLNQRKLGAA